MDKKKIDKAIESIDKVIELNKKTTRLYYHLKLGLYIKQIKTGNENVLVMKFKNYIQETRDMMFEYLIDNKKLYELKKPFALNKSKNVFLIDNKKLYELKKPFASNKSKNVFIYSRLIPDDVYILIGNKNQKHILVKGLELEKERFIVKVN